MPTPTPDTGARTASQSMCSTTALSTAANLSSARLRSQNSTGSAPVRCASSSIIDSLAKLFAVAASAR
jgi:hypothetical protein